MFFYHLNSFNVQSWLLVSGSHLTVLRFSQRLLIQLIAYLISNRNQWYRNYRRIIENIGGNSKITKITFLCSQFLNLLYHIDIGILTIYRIDIFQVKFAISVSSRSEYELWTKKKEIKRKSRRFISYNYLISELENKFPKQERKKERLKLLSHQEYNWILLI